MRILMENMEVKLCMFLFLAIGSTSGQFYNTRCSSPGHCNASQFLTCKAGYCSCDPRTQVFDHALQQCVLRPGGKCFFAGNPGGRVQKCSRNSVCVSSICQCQPGHGIPENGEALCKPVQIKKPDLQLKFQNPCKSPADCDQSKGLTCTSGGCVCQNSSLTYQGMFGCVSPTNPEYLGMMATLKQTEALLKENHLDIDTIVETLGHAEAASDLVPHSAQPRQLFNSELNPFGTIDSSSDLFTSPQTQSGQGIGGLFSAFNNIGSLLGNTRQGQNTGYGVPSQGSQGGYGGGGTGTGTGTGYSSGPGQNQSQLPRNNFPLIQNFLNLFNRLIPFLRRVAQLLNPLRFIQRLLSTLRTIFPVGAGGALPVRGLGLGNFRLPGLGGQGQGGYSGGAGTPTGTGSGNPASSYGPPSTSRPTQGYGPPPVAQGVENFNQVTPIQSSNQQQNTYTNYQAQNPSSPSSPSSNSLSGGTFDSPSSSQYSNYSPQQNKRQVPASGFLPQAQDFQNQNQPSPNNINDALSGDPTPVAAPSSSVSSNKYPRQERNHFEDSSPYLPEHL